MNQTLTIDNKGKQFVQQEEGCRLHAYQDRAGVWTIGYGNTYYLNGQPVKQGDIITQEAADRLFDVLVPRYAKVLNGLNVNQNQANSIVSLAWNIGTTGFLNSSLYRLVHTDPNSSLMTLTSNVVEQDIARQLTKDGHLEIHTITYDFLKWREDAGSFDIGLYERRWREALMYFNEN